MSRYTVSTFPISTSLETSENGSALLGVFAVMTNSSARRVEPAKCSSRSDLVTLTVIRRAHSIAHARCKPHPGVGRPRETSDDHVPAGRVLSGADRELGGSDGSVLE